jgi:two-component system, NtrC family, sensor histidine kinase HydH
LRHLKHPLVVVAGAVVLLVAVRLATAFGTWRSVLPEDRGQFHRYLWIETIADIAVWVVVGGVIVWLNRRSAKAASDRRRLEHLAEMALLSGGLAHEIRNHLNALGTYVSLLRKSAGTQDDGLLGQVEKLEQVASELDELVTDFLTLARPVKDKLEQVKLAELAAEVAEVLSLDLEQSRVEVRVEAAPGIPPVVGDRGKLRRVILNLLINARQAMLEGGRVAVRVRPSGRQVQLDVEDTGCGMPPEDQARVFEAFFSTKSEGTGLGLAVVKRTIEDLGGTISFESQVGRGTTFHILLPSAGQYEATMRELGRQPLEPVSPAP